MRLDLLWADSDRPVHEIHVERVAAEVLERLRAEVETLPDDGPALAYTKLPYLQAVIKETLRLHPVVTEVWRNLDQPLQLGPHLLPAGKAVSASILLAHLAEERFPAPHAFKPERFPGRAYGPFDYLPFGGGHRRCIGAAFSTFEMQISMKKDINTSGLVNHDCQRQ